MRDHVRAMRGLRVLARAESRRWGAGITRTARYEFRSSGEVCDERSRPGDQHGGRTPAGVIIRVLARILALTTAIWHNDQIGQPIKRSLITYDH